MASNRTKWNRTALTAANEVPNNIDGGKQRCQID